VSPKDFLISTTALDDTENKIYRNTRICYNKILNKKFENDIFKVVNSCITNYKKEFNYFGTGSTMEDTGYNHLLYLGTENGEYKFHTDHFDHFPRVLSISLILNDNYDGGDFLFFEKNTMKVEKLKGSAVVFPSNFCFPHAVTPVSNGDRHSIITWIH
jgi:predicted 2-oxoglutarate/Fe(II)-dependent dioxygenase YbiX